MQLISVIFPMIEDLIVCPSCSTENKPSSEFCVNCGTAFTNETKNNETETSKLSYEEKQLKEFRDWKKSVPFTVSTAIFITFIDYITGGTAFDWSYWASVPIILFSVIAPYFSFKISK